MEKKLSKLVLLHSNDIHADFLPEMDSDREVGGLPLLSGYINSVRKAEGNVVYVIAGDMMNGSVMDSDFSGISTLVMINEIKPDAVCVGNHEIDYGVSHALFLDKGASFPLICSNLYIRVINSRLFEPYALITRDDFNILFVGLITESVASSLKNDRTVGRYVTVRDPATEIMRIREAFKDEKLDLVVLLTHIGYEEDLRLAKQLGEESGVGLIIGGHSHTLLTEPVVINGIPIVQVGTGSGQIGRFDIYYDPETKKIDHSEWSLVAVNSETCPVDRELEEFVRLVKEGTDLKYEREVFRLNRRLSNLRRNGQTEMGCFFADVLRYLTETDVFLLNAGAMRTYYMGERVSLRELSETYPYQGKLYRGRVTGAQLKAMLENSLRRVNYDDITSALFHVSDGLHVVYSDKEGKLLSLSFKGTEITDDMELSIGINEYTFKSFKKYFLFGPSEIAGLRCVVGNDREMMDEYLSLLEYYDYFDSERILIER